MLRWTYVGFPCILVGFGDKCRLSMHFVEILNHVVELGDCPLVEFELEKPISSSVARFRLDISDWFRENALAVSQGSLLVSRNCLASLLRGPVHLL